MKLNNLVIIGVAATTVASCAPSKKEYTSYEFFIRSVRAVWQKWNMLRTPRNLRFGRLLRMKCV